MRAGRAVAAAHDRLVVVEALTTKLASVPSLGTPSSTQLPPQSSRSIAWRISAGWPTHSKTWSTPLGRPRSFTAATVSSTDEASMKSVAPNWRATASLPGLASMAMMRPAAAMRAAWMTFRPMPPTPMTTTVSPGRTLARLSTAPVPVTTPQPMRQAASNGTSLVDDDGLGLADDGALGEHAGVGELEGLLAADREGPGQAPEGVAAVGGLAPVAGVALAAVAERGEHDVVADSATLVTPAPTASTTPAPSWPSTTGVGNGMVPSITDTSVWHSPARSMRTSTSPGPGWGRAARRRRGPRARPSRRCPS